MTATTAPVREATATADRPPQRWRFTVDEYERMGATGVFAPDARMELIEGEIFTMAAIGYRHAAHVMLLAELLGRHFGETTFISSQNPLHLSKHSEPEPDVMVLQRRADRYLTALPTPADVLLLIEVSDTTLLFDRKQKLPLYARAGILEVWIVNLVNDTLEICRAPAGGRYGTRRVVRRGDTVDLIALPGVLLAVDDILPQPPADVPDPAKESDQP
ncbi:MAG: Uma2 family endonuclease [Chloroflexota bacterium]|nr:Uma2 family endonuclease [Chloroflexota bacterium]